MIISNIEINEKSSKEIDSLLRHLSKNEIENKDDIQKLMKLKRKANSYKKITIEHENDCDYSRTYITFPAGTTKKFKMEWLKNNNYPTRTQNFNISSDYDCTGKLFQKNVYYKKNIVIIEKLYDC